MKIYDNELAMIFKISNFNDKVSYYPYKLVRGYYDNQLCAFIDTDSTVYTHIINDPENFGYCGRENIEDLKKQYKHLPLTIIKKIKLLSSRRYTYNFSLLEDNVPAILSGKKKKEELSLLLDDDIIAFYCELYPKFIDILMGKEASYEEKIENDEFNVDIKKLYQKVSERVIGQDEPIKKIITAIWKQYNGFSQDKSRNILINGSTGVGKTEIFRVITSILDVPCVMVAATGYTAGGYVGGNVEDMLVALVNKANGDVKKAQRGILIIDEIDKLSESDKSSSQVNKKDVQDALLKLLEDGKYYISLKDDPIEPRTIEFDTKQLMVVGMGSWSNVDLTPSKSVGFNSTEEKKTYQGITREDFVKNGMREELIGRFSEIIQMNPLTEKDFISILKNVKTNILNLNKEFLAKKNVELQFDEEVLKKVAAKAAKGKYGARSLDEIVETALA